MLSFAFYLLKVILCSAVLFGYYWFFLRNKIFHSYNRFYLLAIVILSLALPMMKINIWHKAAEPQTAVIKMLQVVNSSDEYLDDIIVYSHYNHVSKEQVFSLLYIIVCSVFFFMLVQVLFKIRVLLKNNSSTVIENIYFIKTNAKGTPFSFLKFIFWNDAIDIKTKAGSQIFKHEVAHVQERHSYDKLFINIVLIFFWCNPFFWLIRKELNMIHEFIADKKAVEDGDTADFATMILQATYPQYRFPLTNNFFYSPIKRRLLMLTKEHKTKVSYISRLLVLPLTVIVFAAFTIKAKTYSDQLNKKTITVVIDAGHGGTDAGAKATDGSFEKDLSLAFAKKIKEQNVSENIKIILTRESDIYQTPQEKTAFAEKQNADLFISIHMSSAPKTEWNKTSGMEVIVAKDEYGNSESSKLLASSIISSFQNNYELAVAPNPLQRKAGIWVLQASKCPAVLIEAGYLSNEKDLAYLKTDRAVETFAKNVLNAIKAYTNTKTEATNSLTQISEKLNYDTIPKQLPLYILDGKELSVDEFRSIKKGSIDHINKLTGNAAITRYGDKGKFGVIEVFMNKDAITHEKPINGIIDSDIYITGFEIKEDSALNIPAMKWDEDAFAAAARPLLILDGKEVSSLKGYNLSNDNIADIRIFKPQTAMPTYGNKAKNGAIIINTTASALPKNVLIVFDNKIYEGKSWPEVLALNDFRDIDKMELLEKDEAVKKYGAKGKNGVIIVTSRQSTAGPALTITGINGHKIHINQIKNIKDIKCSQPGYTILSATVYFSGAGFPHVIMTTLSGESMQSLKTNLSKLVPGSIMTFDDVFVRTKDGDKMEIKGTSFDFYDNDRELTEVLNHNIIFDKVEVSPGFPGGQDAWQAYLRKNLDANTPIDEGWKAGNYRIIVQFIVDKDGNVSDVTTKDYPNSKTAKQCIDLIKNGPKWLPAYQNGKKVKAYKKQPVTFVVSEN